MTDFSRTGRSTAVGGEARTPASRRACPSLDRSSWIVGFLVILLLPVGVAEAQAPLFLVNSRTRVASVDFDFPGSRTFEEGILKDQIALSGPTLGQDVVGFLAFLPLVSHPTLDPFSPPELLRDVVRLRRFYADAGFPEAVVEYEVALDTVRNEVGVTFRIEEGHPMLLDTLSLEDYQGRPLSTVLPPDLKDPSLRLRQELSSHRNQRFSRSLQIQLRDRVSNWLRNRGYPFPDVSTEARPAERGVHLLLRVGAGHRSRVGEVRVEGASILEPEVLRREVPLKPGDWYSQAELAEGQQELYSLDMVRLARAGPVPVEGPDTVVDVQLRIDEGKRHLLSGQVGFTSESGISGDASWSRRDFLGGGRTLELSAQARTGVWSPEASVAERYGLSALLRQPYVFHRKLEAFVQPFLEYRDEARDRSIEGGVESSLLYRRGPHRVISLRYGITSRWVLEARPGGPLSGGEDLVDLLRGLDTLDLDRRTSRLQLSSRWGRPADARSDRPGWGSELSLEVAGPGGLSTVEYGKVVGQLSYQWPVGGGFLLSGRAGLGRVFPYGVSVPAPDGSDRLEVYLKLRDATLTAGGPRDVRGWGMELLGPKIPDFRVVEAADSTIGAGRYIPLGGLARWTASLQLEAPLPFAGRPHGLHVFLDAGRVWTPDHRFLPPEGPLLPGELDDDVRFGTGVGVTFATPVGPVQLDLGYKLNPSPLDLRKPGAVARAFAAEESLDRVRKHGIRRWHVHLSMGGIR